MSNRRTIVTLWVVLESAVIGLVLALWIGVEVAPVDEPLAHAAAVAAANEARREESWLQAVVAQLAAASTRAEMAASTVLDSDEDRFAVPMPIPGDPRRATLERLAHECERLQAAFFARTDGQQVARSDHAPLVRIDDRRYFREALAGRVAMERVVSRVTNLPALIVAVPVVQAHRIIGVLAARVSGLARSPRGATLDVPREPLSTIALARIAMLLTAGGFVAGSAAFAARRAWSSAGAVADDQAVRALAMAACSTCAVALVLIFYRADDIGLPLVTLVAHAIVFRRRERK